MIYKIFKADSPEELEAILSQKENNKYEPVGGLVVVNDQYLQTAILRPYAEQAVRTEQAKQHATADTENG